MKVVFYKGTSWISLLIRLRTWSKYSHTELQFSDGVCFSANMSYPYHTGFHAKDLTAKWWDEIDIPMSVAEEDKVHAFCESECGCAYDFLGILFAQALPFGEHSPTKWFCSEVCTAALQQAGLLPGVKPCKVSPQGLYRRLIRDGYKICPI